jgi:hypothetical protein
MNARWMVSLFVVACAGTPSAPATLLLAEEPLGPMQASGITVDHRGTRFLLTRDGRVEERVDGEWLRRFHAPPGAYHDLTHVRDDRFALTARNMGFGLDLGTRSLQPYFCYFPEPEVRDEQPPPSEKPTHEIAYAVAYDASNDLLVAQPQTSEDETGDPTFSELAVFDASDGTEQLFRNLDAPSFAAGGMIVLESDADGAELVLGEGTRLFVATFPNVTRRAFLDLASLGVQEIRGLGVDREAGVLEVLDQRGDEAFLISLDLAVVRDAAR